jgi:hypothetical protein
MSYVDYDLSGASGLSFGIAQTNRAAWDTFTRVQLYDSNVSTIKGLGSTTTLHYYNFPTYAEKMQFTQGQFLHLQSYSVSKKLWYSVERNP